MKLYQYVFYCCVACLVPGSVVAQSFLGVTHDKNVITEAYWNPAMAMTSDFCQVNLVGVSVLAQNNGYEVNKSALLSGEHLESGKNYFKIPGNFTRSAWGNLDILGPAVSMNVKKNFTFGIATRFRYFTNVDGFSNDVFLSIDNKITDTNYVYHIDNTTTVAQCYSEINLIASGYLYWAEEFNITGGVSLKILNGIAGVGIGMPQGQFQMHEDNVPFHFKGSQVNLAYTPYANKWLSNGNPLGSLSQTVAKAGLGMDIGFVYNYTPSIDISGHNNGYVFRLGVSVTDIGSIKYPASSSTGTYKSKADSFDLNTVNRDPNATYGQIIDKYVKDSVITQLSSKTEFKIGLPTALRINADVKFGETAHFKSYVNCNIVLNLRKNSAENFSTHYISTLTITPRFMWQFFGFGVPFTFNFNKQGFIGCVFYAGPFYIGTSSLGNFLVLNNVSAADAYIGFSFRLPTRKRDNIY